jgi:hypothetical protein
MEAPAKPVKSIIFLGAVYGRCCHLFGGYALYFEEPVLVEDPGDHHSHGDLAVTQDFLADRPVFHGVLSVCQVNRHLSQVVEREIDIVQLGNQIAPRSPGLIGKSRWEIPSRVDWYLATNPNHPIVTICLGCLGISARRLGGIGGIMGSEWQCVSPSSNALFARKTAIDQGLKLIEADPAN